MSVRSTASETSRSVSMQAFPLWRKVLLGLVVGLAVLTLAWRMVDLQVLRQGFLSAQGDARYQRTAKLVAHRGRLVDRNGEPLALSAPVDSVWADPKLAAGGQAYWSELAAVLGVDKQSVAERLSRSKRRFVYLKRRLSPLQAARVEALSVPGVFVRREYQRFYPAGEVASQLVGFTNVDDHGQEGVELAFDDWLAGVPGRREVIKDRFGEVVQTRAVLQQPEKGRDLVLSIDRRIQYLAYRELKRQVIASKARSGMAVILDARTGELLAAVNQPSFNPNDRRHLKPARTRNRVFTDQFEPGSTMKPFTVMAALGSGRFKVDSAIDTSPGWFKVGANKIRDPRNYGVLTPGRVIAKSSNVGASKMAMALDSDYLSRVLIAFGFGQAPNAGFPGEARGVLRPPSTWQPIEQASLSFGYGLAVSAVQLAHAYSVIANDGISVPVSLLKRKDPSQLPPGTVRLFHARTAAAVRKMMQAVVSDQGTAKAARIPGYKVAGKTGTVRKSVAGGYAEDRYRALFAGIVPASDPRLVMVVVIDEPSAGEYYGGRVAAPVFARTMPGVLRLLNVAPDDLGALSAAPSGALPSLSQGAG